MSLLITDTQKKRLTELVRSYEALEDEKKNISDSQKEIFAEAEAAGLNKKAFKLTLQRRKINQVELANLDATVQLYEESVQ